jgi:hypothetical protein
LILKELIVALLLEEFPQQKIFQIKKPKYEEDNFISARFRNSKQMEQCTMQ